MRPRPITLVGGGIVAGVALAGAWTIGTATAAEKAAQSTDPVGATLTGSGGCEGTGVSTSGSGSLVDTARAPGGGGASTAHPLVVDQNGKVHWQGTSSTVITNHNWWVHVDGIPVQSGGSSNDSRSTHSSGVKDVGHYLPSWLGLTGDFYVNGGISGTGGACTGAVYVHLNGDPATGALFWVAVAFVVGGGVLIYFGLPGRRAAAGPAPAAPVTPQTDEATA
jgi:hypothetical protein